MVHRRRNGRKQASKLTGLSRQLSAGEDAVRVSEVPRHALERNRWDIVDPLVDALECQGALLIVWLGYEAHVAKEAGILSEHTRWWSWQEQDKERINK